MLVELDFDNNIRRTCEQLGIAKTESGTKLVVLRDVEDQTVYSVSARFVGSDVENLSESMGSQGVNIARVLDYKEGQTVIPTTSVEFKGRGSVAPISKTEKATD